MSQEGTRWAAGAANPFAEAVNPYASPQHDGYFPPSGDPSSFLGLWRQGNVLVMHKDAPLPDVCIKSNEPATRRLKRNLSWHHPALFLLILLHIFIYVVVALIVRKKATIQIPLSEEWYFRRRQRLVIAWSVILLSVVLFVGGLILVEKQPWAPWLVIAALPLFLAGAVYGSFGCRLVSPKRMTDQYIWLKGVHPGFLDRLEPWTWSI